MKIELPILIDWKERAARLTAVENLEEKIDKFGMRLRLTGRDYMRLGTTASRVADDMMGWVGKLTTGSLLWESLLEDISWAFEDIGAVIGDILAPWFEWIVDFLEWIADWFESNPFAAWLAVVGGAFLILGWFIGKVIYEIMEFKGMWDLIVGSMIMAKRASLSLGQAINFTSIKLVEGAEAANAYLVHLGKIPLTAKEVAALTSQALSSISDMEKPEKGVSKLGAALEKLPEMETTLPAKEVKKSTKQMQSLGKSTKAVASPLGAVLGLFAGLLGIILAAEPIMEIFSNIVEALSPAFEPLAEALLPIIDIIGDWIEQNPTLALGVIGAVAAILLFLKYKDPLLGFLSKIFGLTGDVSDTMPILRTNVLDLAEAIFILALAVGALAVSLGTCIYFLGLSGFSFEQLLVLIPVLAVTIGGLVGVMILLATTSGLTAAMAAPLVAVILALSVAFLAVGAAVALAGAGFFLAGEGINLACQGITLLVNYVPQVFALTTGLGGLAAGFVALGTAATLAAFPIGGLALAFGALALSIVALASAFAGLKDIGLEAVAQAMGVKLVETLVPHLQYGGIVTEEGLAYLHPGEVVTPARPRQYEIETGPSIVINAYGPGSEAFAEEIARRVEVLTITRRGRSV